MDMQGASPIDPPDEMAGLIDDTDTGFTWHVSAAGLEVIKFQGSPNQIMLETFNPSNAASLGKQTIPLNGISGDFYDIPTVIGWRGNVAYLSFETAIYSLDITTGQLKTVY